MTLPQAQSKSCMKNFANLLTDIETFEESSNDIPKLQMIDRTELLSEFTFPHINRGAVSIVCIEGSVDVVCDKIPLTIPANSMAVMLPGRLIEKYSVSDDFKGFLISASKRIFLSFMPMMSRVLLCSMHFHNNPVIELTESELHAQVLFYKLLKTKLADKDNPFSRLVINKLTEGILCETIANFALRAGSTSNNGFNRKEALFHHFIINVENNYKSNRSVSFYADMLHVSPKHLSSVVKDISGRTAGDWIDFYVINESKRLLSSTDYTIQEISIALNFANQSFFGKYFKSHTGISPREFRAHTLP